MERELELLDSNQVCEMLGISIRSLRNLVFRRRIPVVKVGNLNRFDKREIQAWVSSNARKARVGA